MSITNTAFASVNAQYAVLAWEPIAHSGERINVGTIIQFNDQIIAKPLIRGDVLRCMYGAAGDGVVAMITRVLVAVTAVGNEFGWDAIFNAVPLANFTLLPARQTYALNEPDLFRQIVLMHCSLSAIAEEMDTSAEDSPTPEREVNQQWATKIREVMQIERAELSIYFNRDAVLVNNGIPVKFGFLSPKLAAHFGMLRAGSQAAGMEDARAKMWKLELAKKRNEQLKSALIFGTPGLSEITLSDKQRVLLVANIAELAQEAKEKHILFRDVHSAAEAASAVIAMA